MTMLADRVDAVIGVDTHKRTHTAALVTPTGGLVVHRTAPSDGRGIERLLAYAQRRAPGRKHLRSCADTHAVLGQGRSAAESRSAQ